MEANQAWCGQAAVLMVVLSHKVFTSDGRPNPVHTFDAGAAFENLALQGAAMGLVVHGMAGFDRGQARATLRVPDDYDGRGDDRRRPPGRPGRAAAPAPAREVPSGRKPVREIAREGPFAFWPVRIASLVIRRREESLFSLIRFSPIRSVAWRQSVGRAAPTYCDDSSSPCNAHENPREDPLPAGYYREETNNRGAKSSQYVGAARTPTLCCPCDASGSGENRMSENRLSSRRRMTSDAILTG